MKPDWTYSWDDETDDRQGRLPAAAGDAASGLGSGSVGVALRLAGVAGALGFISFAVLASADPAAGPVADAPPVEAVVARAAPAVVPAAVSAVLTPLIEEPPSRPVQGPMLPRVMSLAPADLCKTIGFGGKAGRWQPSPVYPEEWECLSTKDGRDGKGKTTAKAGFRVFVMARGTDKDDVRYVRFKISADEETGSDESGSFLSERLNLLFKSIEWPLPERALLSTRLRQPFLLDDEGTSIRFVEEKMTPWTYNLIVSFPKAPALAKAARAKATRDRAASAKAAEGALDKARLADQSPPN